MRNLYLLLLLLPAVVRAQAPTGYYNNAQNLSDQPLRVALFNIIKSHTALSYSALWDAYKTTDKKANGKLWDIYSDKPSSTPAYEYDLGTDQCGSANQNNEGFCYNREHTWPKSIFNATPPMYTDLFIVYPTDYYVNGQRSDNPYGKVGTASKTFTNGSKLGSNIYPGAPSGTCFEPIDSFKGDVARNYFYVATCYMADSNTFGNWAMANRLTFTNWARDLLLEWHHLDPVSSKEVARNNAVYAQQGNRNPFIDHPEYADCIWGTGNCNATGIASLPNIANKIKVYPNPAHNDVQINWAQLSPNEVVALDIVNMQGQYLYHQDSGIATQATIHVQDWAKGIYFVRLQTTTNGVVMQKVVVE